MALRWTAAGLLEAQKTFRHLKAYHRQLSILRNALQERLRKAQADSANETIMKACTASSTSDACPANFNRDRDIANFLPLMFSSINRHFPRGVLPVR